MDRDELTRWALAHGWQMLAGCPSLTKPSASKEAIVRMVFKATVVHVEVKKPAGKWEKVAGAGYAAILHDPDTDQPRGIGLDTIPGLARLMQDNADRRMIDRASGTG